MFYKKNKTNKISDIDKSPNNKMKRNGKKVVLEQELTVRAVLLGLILSIVMGAANVYLGLKAGMTVSASVPASVLALLILKSLGNGTLLEANQVQTAASAGESIAAGVIFTIPAMVIIGFWTDFDWLLTTTIAFSGGLLGILLMIPMRKVFIVSKDKKKELIYPEGVACATVLRTGILESKESQDSSFGVIFGTGLGVFSKFIITFLGFGNDVLQSAMLINGRLFYFGVDVSSVLIAVGFIVKLQVALLILSGGVFGWFITLPFFETTPEMLASPLEGAWALWGSKIRYIGVGAMLVGGMASIIGIRKNLVIVVKTMKNQLTRNYNKEIVKDSDRDISAKVIILFSFICFFITLGVYFVLTRSIYISLSTSIIMMFLAFFSVAIASYMAGLVGSSNAPISGVVITVLLVTGGLLSLIGFVGIQGMVATLGVSAVICCACATSNDVAQDLKTGSLIGSSPFKQQITQILGVGIASLTIAPVLQLLHSYTPGGIGGKELSAPQAGLFASLVQGIFGNGNIPWFLVCVGAGIAVVIYIIDLYLQSCNSNIRIYIMPVAIGIYLPLSLSVPMGFGACIAHFIAKGKTGKSEEESLKKGILFSSGVIAGEALMGIAIAGFAALGITRMKFIDSANIMVVLTIVSLLSIIWLFFLGCRNKKK